MNGVIWNTAENSPINFCIFLSITLNNLINFNGVNGLLQSESEMFCKEFPPHFSDGLADLDRVRVEIALDFDLILEHCSDFRVSAAEHAAVVDIGTSDETNVIVKNYAFRMHVNYFGLRCV